MSHGGSGTCKVMSHVGKRSETCPDRNTTVVGMEPIEGQRVMQVCVLQVPEYILWVSRHELIKGMKHEKGVILTLTSRRPRLDSSASRSHACVSPRAC